MKRKYFVIILLFNTLVATYSIFAIQACEKKENKNSFENTEWKLVSIVDYINNTIKIPEPNKDNNFIVKFQENGLASGYSSSNTINGTYNVDYKSQTIKIYFFLNVGGRRHTLQLNADVINIGNLLNRGWGMEPTVGYSSITPLKRENDGTYTFSVANPHPWTYSDINSRWRAQVGIKYTF